MERLIALLLMAPAEWTPTLETELAAVICAALSEQLTLKVSVPCEDPDVVSHMTLVNERIMSQHGEVIHTGGRVWDGAQMHWNWSGYSPALRERIRQAREAAS